MKKGGFRMTIYVAVLAVAAVLSGCAQSAAGIAAKTNKALEKTPCSQLELDLSVNLSVGLGDIEGFEGLEADMTMQADGEITIGYADDTAYLGMDATMEMMGFRVPVSAEMYVQKEDGVLAFYTCMDNTWSREESDVTSLEEDPIGRLDGPLVDVLSIDPDIQELDGTKVYCLTGQVDGEEFSRAGGLLGEALDEGMLLDEPKTGGQSSWENVIVEIQAYVDAQSYLPVQQVVTLKGLDEVGSELLGDLWGQEGYSLKMGDIRIELRYISYEPATPPALPQGAQEAAAEGQRLLEGDPDNRDGTYTIQEEGYYATIRAPEGYVLSDSSYDTVTFYNQEKDRTVGYQMWYMEDQDYSYFWDIVDQAAYEATGEVFGPGRMEPDYMETDRYLFVVDGFQYDAAPGRGYAGASYYAWTSVDDYGFAWVLVRVSDGGYRSSPTLTPEALTQLLENIGPYQPPQRDDFVPSTPWGGQGGTKM